MRFELANLFIQIIETFLANDDNSENYKNTCGLLSQQFGGVCDVVQNKWITDKAVNVYLIPFIFLLN